MSIDDQDHRSDAGFIRAYDADAARRQFQISIGLVAVLALAAVALGMLAGANPPATTAWLPGVAAGGPHIAETLLDIRG